MRILCAFLTVGLSLALLTGAEAQDKEIGGKGKGGQVTLKGTITCPKCDLGIEKGCGTVVVVKKGDKETIYYFDAASNKKHHSQICKEAKPGTVTGTVSKKGDKHLIAVKDVKFE